MTFTIAAIAMVVMAPYTGDPNFAAGLMWNLQRKAGRGVVFGFMKPD